MAERAVNCYVARDAGGGRLEPATPGAILAPFVAVLPEPCATVEEWLSRYHARL